MALPETLTREPSSNPKNCEPALSGKVSHQQQKETTILPRPVRIIHVDDDLVEHKLVRKHLSSLEHLSYELISLNNFPEALDRLRQESFDVGLIDYHLGAHTGLELLTRLGGRLSSTPLVILTGRGDYTVDVEATNAGAFDYLDKNELTPALLERTIRNVRVQFKTEQQLRESETLLKHAKTEAEAANRAKSEFLARMSHDLRTPLNAILGFSEMIQGQFLGPVGGKRYLDYASDIHQSGQLLLTMINDILDLSKIESGNVELHDIEIAVDELISTALKLIEPGATLAGISIRTRLDPALPLLRADRQMVDRMLFNLLTNSMKFTPRGGEIVIQAKVSGGDVQLIVEDNGIGIAANQINHVLEPFTQLKSSQEPSSGAGLGLAITHSFIEIHGGTLTVESELGSGTRATLTFPSNRLH
ncbi:hybrid sensor histidine kinase/response regulator [Pelagibius sp. Alg239-R121]|uniref:ATP-binding response regulator n=1 Tax=Pelagibius sp. Alg239-R121 TaxID=2993448 RepID=UPI0024A64C85|nr:hybrid sensor histidine kinase/response regulator [Pelagibius sp. Alg239-R121]